MNGCLHAHAVRFSTQSAQISCDKRNSHKNFAAALSDIEQSGSSISATLSTLRKLLLTLAKRPVDASSHPEKIKLEKLAVMNALKNKVSTQPTDANNSTNLSELLISELIVESVPVIDTQVLESFSSDKSFLIEICQSFLHCAPERIEAIQSAIEENNAAALRESAHALKSLSTCIGATHLFQCCKAMEAVGRSDRLAIAAKLFNHVITEYSKVKASIQIYQHSLSITL